MFRDSWRIHTWDGFRRVACSALLLRVLAPPLPSGQNSLQLAPAAAPHLACETLNPLGVMAPAAASCSASALASPCPTVAASPNMSLFVQPSLGDPSVLSTSYPAPSAAAGSPFCLCWTEVALISMAFRVVVLCRSACVLHDSGGAITPVRGC